MVTELFELLAKLKNVKKYELIITKDEEFIMKAFHKKLKGVIPYKLWRKIVIQYSIDTLEEIYDSCDTLVDQIYEKYKKI